MTQKLSLTLFFLFFLNLSSFSSAKTFQNSYIRFDLPNNWDCELIKTAYLCHYKVSKPCRVRPAAEDCKKEIKKPKEAMIIMAAKEKTEMDSLDSYLQNLNETRKIKTTKRATFQSKTIHNKKVKIRKQAWVDGMLLGSEFPYYYSRYLSTIKGDVAVLVTFNAHKLYYTKYSNLFFKSIKSLQVTTSNINKVKKIELGPKVLSQPIDIPDDLLNGITAENNESQQSYSSALLFFFGIILAAAGIYVWIKNFKK